MRSFGLALLAGALAIAPLGVGMEQVFLYGHLTGQPLGQILVTIFAFVGLASGSRWRKRPRPGAATHRPPSATTSPRAIVTTGQPQSSMPSYGLQSTGESSSAALTLRRGTTPWSARLAAFLSCGVRTGARDSSPIPTFPGNSHSDSRVSSKGSGWHGPREFLGTWNLWMACAGDTHYIRSASKVRVVDIGECRPLLQIGYPRSIQYRSGSV